MASSSAAPLVGDRSGLCAAVAFGWPASRNPLFGLANRPPPRHRLPGQTPPDVVAVAPRMVRPWAFGELALSSISSASSGSSSRRIRLRDAPGGCGRPGGRGPLWSGPRSSTRAEQAFASSTGFRSSRTMFSISAACSRSRLGLVAGDDRYFLQPGLLGGAPAALAGDQFVAAVGERADQQRLDDPGGLDRGGQGGRGRPRRSGCGAGSGRLDQVDRQFQQLAVGGVGGRLGRIAASPRPESGAPFFGRAATRREPPWPGRRRRRRRARRGVVDHGKTIAGDSATRTLRGMTIETMWRAGGGARTRRPGPSEVGRSYMVERRPAPPDAGSAGAGSGRGFQELDEPLEARDTRPGPGLSRDRRRPGH